MKNVLKKLQAWVLSFMIIGTFPIYGASPKPVLKLDDAVSSALMRSNQVSLNLQENDLLKEQQKAMREAPFVTYQTIYLTKAKNEQQAEIIKDQIAYDITNRYNNLVLLEKEVANLDASIRTNTNKLQVLAHKKKKGLISVIEYNNASIQLDMQKNSRHAKHESLKNDKNHFKVLTGKNLDEYTLDDTLAYVPLSITGSVDSYMNNKIAQYLKYDKDIVALQADNILQEGSAPMPWAVYLGEKYKVDKNIYALENSEKNLKQALMNSYSSLLALEEQIMTVQNQLKLLENQLSMLQLQKDAGLITALDYEAQQITFNDTECILRKLINSYNSLKTSIEKPWAAMGGN